MFQYTKFKRRFTCGQHVTGHGQKISMRGGPASFGKDQFIEKGVITMLPGKSGQPYTVLDERTFAVLEAREENLLPLS